MSRITGAAGEQGLFIIDWQSLQKDYIEKKIPFRQSLLRMPKLELCYWPDVQRIGFMLEAIHLGDSRRLLRLKNITHRFIQDNGGSFLELSTNNTELFRAFHLLTVDLLNRLCEQSASPMLALGECLDDFEALIEASRINLPERIIGLYGELLILDQLIRIDPECISSWVGPKRQAHDFRRRKVELEVKTTTANVREHIIHGISQLDASPGSELYLVSIRLGLAGESNGRSLKDLVIEISEILSNRVDLMEELSALLLATDINFDSFEASVLYIISAPLMIIKVDDEFPRISPDFLRASLGNVISARIRDVQYRVNVEGLGKPFNPAEIWSY